MDLRSARVPASSLAGPDVFPARLAEPVSARDRRDPVTGFRSLKIAGIIARVYSASQMLSEGRGCARIVDGVS